MNARTIGLLAIVGSGIVAVHGITSKKWQEAHSIFVVLGVLTAAVSLAEGN